MATFVMSNNASSTLAAPINNSALSVTLAAGTGSLFPNPSAGQQFPLTFNDAATGLLTEIVYCTARSGDVLTIVRAQEGTAAQNWLAGDLAANLITAAVLAAFQQSAALNPARTVNVGSGGGVFSMSTADANGGILVLQTHPVGVQTSTTLPVSPNGVFYEISDGTQTFATDAVLVNFPGGTTGPNGLASFTCNQEGVTYRFKFYADSNTWSVSV